MSSACDCNPKAEHEGRLVEGAWVKSVQIEGKGEIAKLREQITQLQVVMQRPPVRTVSDHLRHLGNGKSAN